MFKGKTGSISPYLAPTEENSPTVSNILFTTNTQQINNEKSVTRCNRFDILVAMIIVGLWTIMGNN